MRNLIRIAGLAIIILAAGCSRSDEGGNYTQVSADDAEMNAAIEKAKATTNEFLEAFRARKAGTSDYFVKKGFATPSGGKEHMWIEVTGEENGVLKGTVANEPQDTREVKMGQPVSISLSDISDWKYQQGKKLIGGFTIRCFVERMPAAERAAFLSQAGFEL